MLPAGCRPREDWECWTAHLAARKSPRPYGEIVPPGKQHPLLWALPEETRPAWLSKTPRRGSTIDLRELLSASEGFLAERMSEAPTLRQAIECLAWCQALSMPESPLPSETWWKLFDRLVETAREAAGISLSRDPLANQLLAGELPLTLAWLFPELPECRELAETARTALSRGPSELLDGEGAPAAAYLPLLRPLLATWTRCSYLGRELGGRCFSDAAEADFEWLIRHALRATRHDGRQVLSPGPEGDWSPDLFAAALNLRRDWEDAEIADCLLPGRKSKRTAATRRELPAPPTHSEWAESGLLRYDWARSSDFLAATFHEGILRAELNCGADTLWSGDWNPTVSVEGQRLVPKSGWEVVCWHTDDDDVIYLELELRYEGDWRVQRQLLLAGHDRFLLACDSVLGGRAAQIDYRCSLPLSSGTRFEPCDETREGLLISGRRRRLVVPLALPEWQAERTTGSLEMTAEGLTLSQSTSAAGLFAPLFVDLDPSRVRRPRTWRRLTVAEKLEVVPHDSAAAFRIQVGAQQWLVYRSFRQPSNRSVLGQNVATECLVGRFQRAGDVKELLEIE